MRRRWRGQWEQRFQNRPKLFEAGFQKRKKGARNVVRCSLGLYPPPGTSPKPILRRPPGLWNGTKVAAGWHAGNHAYQKLTRQRTGGCFTNYDLEEEKGVRKKGELDRGCCTA